MDEHGVGLRSFRNATVQEHQYISQSFNTACVQQPKVRLEAAGTQVVKTWKRWLPPLLGRAGILPLVSWERRNGKENVVPLK